MKVLLSVLLLVVWVGAESARAQSLQKIYVFQWGEYEVDGRIANATVSPQGVEHSIDTSNWRHIRTARTIVARLGTEFCFRYWPTGVWTAVASIRIVTNFPAPGVTARQSRMRVLREERVDPIRIGYPEMWCWSFDHPDDIAVGEWRIEIWSGETRLAEQRFTVILPGTF